MKIKIITIISFCLLSIYAFTQNGINYKGKFYQAMPMPVANETNTNKNTAIDLIQNSSYNIATKEVASKSIDFKSPLNANQHPAKTMKHSLIDTTTTKSFSDLSQVTNPEAYPNSVNVKLFMEYPTGNLFVCSGTLIDSKHVLTAGHCIYSDEEGGWATSVEVVPGYENGAEPFGSALATDLYSWTGWTTLADFNWDMGYMVLDRSIGASTGWNGFGYNTNNAHYTSGNWINNSYPAEAPFDGQLMYTWNGTFDDIQTDLLYHNDLGYGGQSGSGTHLDLSVHSVASHTFLDANNNRIPPFGHCRMVQTRFDAIVFQIDANTSDAADLIPILTFAEPTNISAGEQLDSLALYVFNGGEAAFNGDFNMSFYLSDNDIISTADVELGTYNWSNVNLQPDDTYYSWVSPASRPIIPTNTPEGTYYIGVIINNVDGDTNNNTTSSFDLAEIYVGPPLYCQGTTLLTDQTGSFSDGSDSNNYNNNSDCRWHINPVGAQDITLQFSQFDLESSYDFVYVYSDLAETNLVATLTGSSLPADITVTGDELAVRFVTDGSVVSTGFDANYFSTSPTFCSGITNLIAPSGSFSDGSGPVTYLNDSDCTWVINPPNATKITLSFTAFDLENDYDFVYVYDDVAETNLVATLSGGSIPNDVIVSGNEMVVRFITDSSVIYDGFECNYFSSSSNCYNDDVYLPEGIIDSGEYNTDYTITSHSTIPETESVIFNAYQGVTLGANFNIEDNAVLEIQTVGCNNNN